MAREPMKVPYQEMDFRTAFLVYCMRHVDKESGFVKLCFEKMAELGVAGTKARLYDYIGTLAHFGLIRRVRSLDGCSFYWFDAKSEVISDAIGKGYGTIFCVELDLYPISDEEKCD